MTTEPPMHDRPRAPDGFMEHLQLADGIVVVDQCWHWSMATEGGLPDGC